MSGGDWSPFGITRYRRVRVQWGSSVPTILVATALWAAIAIGIVWWMT